MRLLFVTHSFPPPGRFLASVGGLQRGAAELHAALAARPDLDVATFAISPPWKWAIARTALFMPRLAVELPRRVRRHRAEVVLFTSPVTGSIAPFVRGRLPDVRLVTVANGHDVLLRVAPYQVLLRRTFAVLDGVLPVSRATAEACIERGARPERTIVIPTGVQTERFSGDPDRTGDRRWLRERLGLAPEAFVVIGLGRQVRRKGTAWFIRHVLPLLPPYVHYVVAGDGPEMEAIQAAAAEGALGTRAHLLGRVAEDDLPRLLRASDLFAMPNVPVEGDMEGLGLVAFEASLCGLPVLASDMEGMRETVAEGQNGHLLPPLHAPAFAEAVARYAADPEALAALSDRARAYVRQTFAWPVIAERYRVALDEIVGVPVVA